VLRLEWRRRSSPPDLGVRRAKKKAAARRGDGLFDLCGGRLITCPGRRPRLPTGW
jgi:hypothetical protein